MCLSLFVEQTVCESFEALSLSFSFERSNRILFIHCSIRLPSSDEIYSCCKWLIQFRFHNIFASNSSLPENVSASPPKNTEAFSKQAKTLSLSSDHFSSFGMRKMSKNRFVNERFSLRGARNRYRRQSNRLKACKSHNIITKILKNIRIEKQLWCFSHLSFAIIKQHNLFFDINLKRTMESSIEPL